MKVKLKRVSSEHLDLFTWCKKAACHRWLASWRTYRIHGTCLAPAETHQMGFTPNKWKKSQDFTCIFWTTLVNFHYTRCLLRQTRKASGRMHSDAVLVYSILLILISHFLIPPYFACMWIQILFPGSLAEIQNMKQYELYSSSKSGNNMHF